MCKELEEQLEHGSNLAKQLVEHMRYEMNADAGMIPVFLEDERYEISIKHVPVKPEQP
jgi:hypothetical protein